MTTLRHQLRVNVKSLAAEGAIIRREIQKARDVEAKAELACHRMERVRPEARLAQLAYAFVRNVPYKTVEAKTAHPVDPDTLEKKLRKFYVRVMPGAVRAWLNA